MVKRAVGSGYKEREVGMGIMGKKWCDGHMAYRVGWLWSMAANGYHQVWVVRGEEYGKELKVVSRVVYPHACEFTGKQGLET